MFRLLVVVVDVAGAGLQTLPFLISFRIPSLSSSKTRMKRKRPQNEEKKEEKKGEENSTISKRQNKTKRMNE